MSFQKQLATGRVAEGWIAQWLMARGHKVMPAYEIEVSQFKGPQLFSAQGEFVSPDMIVFSSNGVIWVEAKHKSVFTWYRKGQRWTTGIDYHHYTHYQEVARQTGLPVWLAFFHRESRPDSRDLRYKCPPKCPTGLFIEDLSQLVLRESHRSPAKDAHRKGVLGHGRYGMVYWSDASLRRVASCEEVYALAQETRNPLEATNQTQRAVAT